jgi:biopolymer transport protein ExbD
VKLNLQNHKRARIEMLPLIDIVFLLLVFFIYAMLSMAVHRGLPVLLPKSISARIDKKLVLSVTVKQNGTVYVDKERVLIEELSAILKRKAKGEKEPGVLLFADQGLTYQGLFRVLDQIRIAGLDRISLQAEVEPQP